MQDRPSAPRPAARERPRVVIAGAGFAGLEAARALGRSGAADVTVLDRHNYHLFQPLLYQAATAALSPADIASPVRAVLRRYRNVEVLLGEAVAINPGERTLGLKDGRTLSYDRLILATGSAENYFGRPEWAEHAPGLKTIADARRIRSRLLLAFERAEMAAEPEDQRRLTSFVIIGGGPTGVELAGSIAALSRRALAGNFRRIRPECARVVLIEAGERVLAGFPERLSDYAARRLERMGVELRLGAAVEDVTEDGVALGGERIDAGCVIWAAGVRATPAGRWLGVETDEAGRIPVAPDLSVPGCDGVYAIGDLACALDSEGRPLPGLAQTAKQQGRFLGRALARNLRDGTPVPPFVFRNRGMAAIITRHSAVFDFGRWTMTGAPAWALWALVHIFLLTGGGNRLSVSVKSAWRYLTFQRGARLIAEGPAAAPMRGLAAHED